MIAVLQNLLANSPSFVGLVILYFMIKNQGVKMEKGFKNVENEFKVVRGEMREEFLKVALEFQKVRSEMSEGFLKVNSHLEIHDLEIKRIKRKLKLKKEKPHNA